MRKYIFFIFISIGLLHISCEKKERKNILLKEPIKSIKIEGKYDNIDFDSIIKNYEYIPLETNENALIGKIHKIIIEGDNIIILDKDISKSIFLFNRDGKYIRTIGAIGKGPNEYLKPQDISINRKRNTINIYCSTTKKILEFSFDGKHLSTIDTRLSFKSFEFLNKDTIAAFVHGVYNEREDFGKLPYDLIFFNRKMNILDKQFFNNTEVGIGNSVITYNRYFSHSKNTLYLSKLLHDTIYKIDNLKASPFLFIDFGRKRITEEVYSKHSEMEIFKKIIKDEYRSIIRPVKTTSNHMLIEYGVGIDNDDPDSNYRILYELNSKKNFQFKNIDIGIDGCSWIMPVDTYGENFINVIYPENFACIRDKDIKNKLFDKNSNKLSNPILLLYTFKKIDTIK